MPAHLAAEPATSEPPVPFRHARLTFPERLCHSEPEAAGESGGDSVSTTGLPDRASRSRNKSDASVNPTQDVATAKVAVAATTRTS